MPLKYFSSRLRPSRGRTPSKEDIRMHRPGLRASLLALAAVAVIAAATTAVTANARSQATTITFWQTMNDQETVTLKDLVSKFEDSHPDIKIDMVTVPFDQRVAKF